MTEEEIAACKLMIKFAASQDGHRIRTSEVSDLLFEGEATPCCTYSSVSFRYGFDMFKVTYSVARGLTDYYLQRVV